MSIFTSLHNEWLGRGIFLGRGNFSELMLSIAEVLTGVHILLFGEKDLIDSILLLRFDGVIPIYLLGLIWLFAGCFTLIGIVLYMLGYRTNHGYKVERLFRFVGSLFSIYIWLSAAIALSPSPFAYIYYGAAIASMRVTRMVWRS